MDLFKLHCIESILDVTCMFISDPSASLINIQIFLHFRLKSRCLTIKCQMGSFFYPIFIRIHIYRWGFCEDFKWQRTWLTVTCVRICLNIPVQLLLGSDCRYKWSSSFERSFRIVENGKGCTGDWNGTRMGMGGEPAITLPIAVRFDFDLAVHGERVAGNCKTRCLVWHFVDWCDAMRINHSAEYYMIVWLNVAHNSATVPKGNVWNTEVDERKTCFNKLYTPWENADECD